MIEALRLIARGFEHDRQAKSEMPTILAAIAEIEFLAEKLAAATQNREIAESLRENAERYKAIRRLPDLIVVLRDTTATGISAEWPGAPGWRAIETGAELDGAADTLRAAL